MMRTRKNHLLSYVRLLLNSLIACLAIPMCAFAQAPILESVTSSSQTVTLTVQATTTYQGYTIYRVTTSGSENYTQRLATQTLSSPPTIGTTFTLTDPTAPYGQTFYYKVSITSNDSSRAPMSNELSVVSQVIPAPTQVAATGAGGQVLLSWVGNASATSYNVKRSTTSGGPYTTIRPGITATTFTDTTVMNGTEYYYVVSAAGSTGESLNSLEASAIPQTGGAVIRINCGGSQYTDHAGKIWLADQGANGGGPITTTSPISGTNDPALYQAQHTSSSSPSR